MNKAIRELRNLGVTSLYSVVHLGAGGGRELPEYLAFDARKIRLVEPHPESAAKLREASRGQSHVEVVEAAASTTSGDAPFFVMNNRSGSSLLKPTALLSRFPNLRVREEIRVRTIAIAEILTDVQREQRSSNVLVVDINGMEGPVLDAAGPELEVFDFIILRTSAGPMFEGAFALDQIASALAEVGFTRRGQVGPQQAVAQELLFGLDRNAALQRRLTSQLEEREARIGQLAAQLTHALGRAESMTTVEAELRGLNSQLDERCRALTNELGALKSESETREKLLQDRQARVTVLEAQWEVHEQRVVALQNDLQHVIGQRDEQTRLAVDREAAIQDISRAAELAQARTAELANEVSVLQKAGAERAAKLEVQTQLLNDQLRLSDEHRQHVERLSKSCEEQAEAIIGKSAEVDRLEKLVAEGEERVRNLTASLDAVRPRIAQLSAALAEEHAAAAKRLAELEQQAKLAEERKAALEQVSKAQDEQGKQLAASRLENERLAAEYKEKEAKLQALSANLAASQARINELTTSVGQLQKQVSDRQIALEQQAKIGSEQSRIAQERKSAAEQLSKERDQQAKFVADQRAELERLRREAKESLDQLAKLQAALKERDWRQSHLNQEVLKAEAQIDLIKDVLLREPTL